MKKEDFIQLYCEKSNIKWEELSKYKTVLPCACGDDLCKGWAIIPNDPESVATHMRLYAPESEENGKENKRENRELK